MTIRYKSTIGVTAIALVGVSLLLYARYEAIKTSVIDKRKAEVAAFIQARASAMIKPEDFNSQDPLRRSKVFESFFEAIHSPELVRMKVWDRNYTVLWSNLTELIGQRFPDNHEVKESFEGKVEFEIDRPKEEHVFERAFLELAEIYVPFPDGDGKIVGVIEIYQPAFSLHQEIRGRFLKSAIPIVIIASLGCFAAALVPRFSNRWAQKKGQK